MKTDEIKSEIHPQELDSIQQNLDDLDVANDENPESPEPLRLLSLDGGGVRGLSSLVILQQLMHLIDNENPPRPCDVFHMIGGTSTGGLIAIMLGRLEMTVDECIGAYLSLSERVFKKGWFRWANFFDWRFNVQPKFSSSELERAIKDIIDEYEQSGDRNAKLKIERDPLCKVFVCTQNYSSSKAVHFRNYACEGLMNDEEDVKIWEAARATSAAPTFFHPVQIGRYKEKYMDGATGSNNPVEELWDSAQEYWPAPPGDDFHEQVQCLVSIGTGIGPEVPFGSQVFEIFRAITKIATETEDTADRFSRGHTNLQKAGKYFRFNVPGLGSIGMDEEAKKSEIMSRTRYYCKKTNTRKEMRECVNQLSDFERRTVEDSKSNFPRLRNNFGSRDSASDEESPVGSSVMSWLWYLGLILILYWVLVHPSSTPFGNTQDLDPLIPIIAVMGKTGVGKSTFIDTLEGKSIHQKKAPVIGHGLESSTEKLTWYEATLADQKVYLIDTPGFDDSRMPDTQIMGMLSEELAEYYKGDKLLRGIIYLHDISQSRVGGLAKQNFDFLEKLVGKGAFQNVILVTTKWIKRPVREEESLQASREHELETVYWKDMLRFGSTMMRHDGSYASARLIVMHLRDKARVILQHQHERVDEGKSFSQTVAGQTMGEGPEVVHVGKRSGWTTFFYWCIAGLAMVLLLVLLSPPKNGNRKS